MMGLQDSSTQPQAAEDNKYRDRATARRDMKDEYEAGRFLETWGCLGYKPLVWVHRCLLDYAYFEGIWEHTISQSLVGFTMFNGTSQLPTMY